jgi:drug/metabolite transporter (DMT)-like permease
MKIRIEPGSLLALGTTLLLWASAFAGIRAGLTGYSPGHLALLRFIVASLALAVYAAATRMKMPEKRDLPGIALTGWLGISGYNLALNYGETSLTAGVASFMVNTGPVFTALLAMTFLGERLRGWGWLGIAVSFGGVSLIALAKEHGFSFDPAVLLVLLAAFLQSLYFVLQKPYLKRYRPFEFTTYAIWAGTLGLLVFWPGLPAEMGAAPPEATLATVYLGIFPAALAYVTWAYVLARFPASRAASFLYLVPGVATLIAWLWLGEVPGWLALLGGVIALTGVIIVNKNYMKRL